MTAVSLTLRLNVNKFATLTYYRPKMQPAAVANMIQGGDLGQGYGDNG